MVTRSITFRDDVNDQLVETAERLHVSVNWLVNQLCREGLAHAIEEITVVHQ